MKLTLNLNELPPAVRQAVHKQCSEENARELVAAIARQRHIAKFYRDNKPRSMNGVGEQDMSIDPYWVNYFHLKYGIHPLEDEDFRKWIVKGNEEFKVRSGGTRMQVGWSGAVDCCKQIFRKVYPSTPSHA